MLKNLISLEQKKLRWYRFIYLWRHLSSYKVKVRAKIAFFYCYLYCIVLKGYRRIWQKGISLQRFRISFLIYPQHLRIEGPKNWQKKHWLFLFVTLKDRKEYNLQVEFFLHQGNHILEILYLVAILIMPWKMILSGINWKFMSIIVEVQRGFHQEC